MTNNTSSPIHMTKCGVNRRGKEHLRSAATQPVLDAAVLKHRFNAVI